LVLNGERLPLNPPPRIYHAHLLVPVRDIIKALGLDFSTVGRDVVTHVGSKTVTLRAGSARAYVGGNPVALDAAPVEIKNVLYAPLRFFTDALGAQASFDRKANTVTVVAQLVGRSGNGILAHGSGIEQIGTVQAVDMNSDPPTITITYNASIRTVQIGRNADILLQDVNANVTVPGELSDVHPGDFAHLYGRSRSVADRVIDAFGSRVGVVAAIGSNEIVLNDGHVVAPGRDAIVSIDGSPATIAQAQVGDSATVRYNVESGEIREVLLSRSVALVPAPAPANGPLIGSVTTNATRPLRARETLTVTLRGTPGGAATFDVGPYVSGIAMRDLGDGTYVGKYIIPSGANFSGVPVIGHLRADGVTAPPAQALATVSASSSPPGISDFAPDDGSTVSSDRPAIYAAFVADAVAVDPSSATMSVDGHDVTSGCVRSAHFIEYVPTISYPSGPVRVVVRVSDYAGNQTTKAWTFTVRR
jgi:hypothetical protein